MAEMKQMKKAYSFAIKSKKAIETKKDKASQQLLARIYFNLAVISGHLKRIKEALRWCQKSLEVCKEFMGSRSDLY